MAQRQEIEQWEDEPTDRAEWLAFVRRLPALFGAEGIANLSAHPPLEGKGSQST